MACGCLCRPGEAVLCNCIPQHVVTSRPLCRLETVALHAREPLWVHAAAILLENEAHDGVFVTMGDFLVQWTPASDPDDSVKLFSLLPQPEEKGANAQTWDDSVVLTSMQEINRIRGQHIGLWSEANMAVRRLTAKRGDKMDGSGSVLELLDMS